MRRKVAALFIVLAAIFVSAPSTAGAAQYNECPLGWWVHDNAGSGTVMQCVSYGNHIVIRQWIGGVDGGVVFDAWLPGWLDWFVYPASGSATSELLFCDDHAAEHYPYLTNSIAAGWERSWYAYGRSLQTIHGAEGVVNFFYGWAGVQPYGAIEQDGTSQCYSGLGLTFRAG